MLRPLTLLACSIALAFTITSADAKKNKGPLPCGDYDGAPSHNDCAPVSDELKRMVFKENFEKLHGDRW